MIHSQYALKMQLAEEAVFFIQDLESGHQKLVLVLGYVEYSLRFQLSPANNPQIMIKYTRTH